MIRMKVYKLSQLISVGVVALMVLLALIMGFVWLGGRNTRAGENTAASVQTDAALNLSENAAVPVTAEGKQSDFPDEPERIRAQVRSIRNEFAVTAPKDKPRVLIYHTHSYEAYSQDPEHPYTETSRWRTKDRNYNIMGVGTHLTEELEKYGIEVVHDMTEHEPPKLGTAYERSLKTLQRYADAGEEFDLIIDLHRDAASDNNRTPSCVEWNGKEYARLMLLIGTGEGSSGNTFKIKPDWKKNYALAQALTEQLNAQIDGICRDVMVKTGRYNQHMSVGAVLIEVGHNENTLSQAMNTVEPLAQAIAEILKNGDGN